MDSVILENVVRFGLLFVALWAIRKLPRKGEETQADRPRRICLYVLSGIALVLVTGIVIGCFNVNAELGPWFAAMLAALVVILAGYLFGTYRICKGATDAV